MSPRTNSWLTDKLRALYAQSFADVPITNTVLVKFGKKSRGRLGSIVMKPKRGYDQKVSVISLNRILKDERVPEYVIDAVLAHEFVHYAHGFNSPLPQLYRYPHQAGIVDRELKNRGLEALLKKEKWWTKHNFAKLWKSVI